MKELNINALGGSLGILSAVCMLIMTLAAANGYYTAAYDVMIKFHVLGADLTLGGGVIGVLEAGVWGYVSGALTAWLYNKFA